MTGPTVTVGIDVPALYDYRLCATKPTMVSPELRIEITYPLGDHAQTLLLLEDAVADVRRQIADAAEGAPS